MKNITAAVASVNDEIQQNKAFCLWNGLCSISRQRLVFRASAITI